MSWTTWKVAGRTNFVKASLCEAEHSGIDLGPFDKLPAKEKARLLVGAGQAGEANWYWQPHAGMLVAFPLVEDGKPYSERIKRMVARQGLQTQLDLLKRQGTTVLAEVQAGTPLREVLARPGVTFTLAHWLVLARFDCVTVKPEEVMAMLYAANGPGEADMKTLWKVAGTSPAEERAMQLPSPTITSFVTGRSVSFPAFLKLAEDAGIDVAGSGLATDNAKRDVAEVTREGFKLKPAWKGGFDKDILNDLAAQLGDKLEKRPDVQLLLKRASAGEWFFYPEGNDALVNTCDAVSAGYVAGVTCYVNGTLGLGLKTANRSRCFGIAYKLEGQHLIDHVSLWERMHERQEVVFTTAQGTTVRATYYNEGGSEKRDVPVSSQAIILRNIRREFQSLGVKADKLDTLMDWYRKTLFDQ